MVFHPENYYNVTETKINNKPILSILDHQIKNEYDVSYQGYTKIGNQTFTTPESLHVCVTFDKSLLFMGDSVNYSATAYSSNPLALNATGGLVKSDQNNIANLWVVVGDPKIDTINPPDDPFHTHTMEILDALDKNHAILLQPTTFDLFSKQTSCKYDTYSTDETYFLNSGTLSFPYEGDEQLDAIVMPKVGEVGNHLDPEPIFRIYPATERLQVVTNQATLDQIQETEKQIKFQDKTDTQIVGLSLVAVLLAPILIGSDIILRIYLEPHTDEMRKENLFNYKFWTWFKKNNYSEIKGWNCDWFHDE